LSDADGLLQLCGRGEERGGAESDVSGGGGGGGCSNLRILKLDHCKGVKASGLCWLMQVRCSVRVWHM
jgi:hypothetical protein